MQYFIHADDFGSSPERNAAIDEGIRSGWLHRTTLIVNTPASDEACAMAERGNYRDQICFHLNLTNGDPLTAPIRETFLCKSDGSFSGPSLRSMAVHGLSPRVIKAIRQECDVQMSRFREMGFTSSHIDAHFWCLCADPVWRAIRPLVEKYEFKTTRTFQGHHLGRFKGMTRRYYDFVFHSIGRKLRFQEDRALLFREFQRIGEAGGFGDEERVELYVHPRMMDGVCKDVRNFRIVEDQVPLEEIASEAARFGSLIKP